MGRYGGHRIPDEYSKDWKGTNLGEYWDWWHLGYEDGYSQCEWDYGLLRTGSSEESDKTLLSELERLQQKITSLEMNFEANVRVARQEIRKELESEINSNSDTGHPETNS